MGNSEQRCAECDCKNGGSDCNWIATPKKERETPSALTEEKGYADGVASGTRVPREHDYFDLVHAANKGGPDYAKGFCRGVDEAPKGELASE